MGRSGLSVSPCRAFTLSFDSSNRSVDLGFPSWLPSPGLPSDEDEDARATMNWWRRRLVIPPPPPRPLHAYMSGVSLMAFTASPRRQQLPTDQRPLPAGVLSSEETASTGRRKKPLLPPPLMPSLLSVDVRTGAWGCEEEEDENMQSGGRLKATGVVTAATKRPRQQAVAVEMRRMLLPVAAAAVAVEAGATTRAARSATRPGPSIGYGYLLLCTGICWIV